MSRKRRKAAPRPTENTVRTVLGRLCGCCSLSEQLAIHAQQYDSLLAMVNPPEELVVSAPFVSSSQTPTSLTLMRLDSGLNLRGKPGAAPSDHAVSATSLCALMLDPRPPTHSGHTRGHAHADTHGHTHRHAHAHIHTHGHMWIHMDTHAWTHTCRHTRGHMCTYMDTHVWIITHNGIQADAHEYAWSHVYMHADTLTRVDMRGHTWTTIDTHGHL